MTAIRFLVAVLFLALGATTLPAKWNYFRSDHFELYADGKKGNAEEVLNHLEQVRDLFSRLNGDDFAGDRPVRVIAFNSATEFKKVHGRRGGESPYAFYTQSRDRNYIVFQELTTDQMFEVAIHEYVHLRTREMGVTFPVWLSEGLAGLYSTVRPRGGSVHVGYTPSLVRSVGFGRSLKLDELLTTTRRDSKFWKSRTKVLSLYAKGWALASLLTMHPEYRENSSEFLLAVAAGETGADAFLEVYGKNLKQVAKDLDAYTNGLTLPVLVYPTEWNRDEHAPEPTPVSDVDEQLMMADLLGRMGQIDEARKRFASVLDDDSDNSEAHAGVGRFAGDVDVALASYARAAELGSTDPYLYLDYARALFRRGAEQRDLAIQMLAEAARHPPELSSPHLVMAALAKQDGEKGKELLHLRRANSIDAVAAYTRTTWISRTAAEMGNTLQSRQAAQQAAQYVRTKSQLLDVYELLREPGVAVSLPFTEIDVSIESGDLDEAANALVEMQKQYPKAVPIYERFAELQRRRGDGDRAELTAAAATGFRRSAVIDQKRYFPEASRQVALLDAAGLYETSQLIFSDMADLNPEDWVQYNNRAYELAQQEALIDEAVELAERAMELAPNSSAAIVQDTLGWVYLKAKRTEDAIKIFAGLVDEAANVAIYQFHYGVALAQGDRPSEAIKAYDEALRSKTPSDGFRAEIEEAREKAERALAGA